MTINGRLDAIPKAIKSRAVSASEAIQAVCEALHRSNGGSFWAIDDAGALREARRIDHALARGEDPGVLAGIPFGVKDCIDVSGLPTTCGIIGQHPPKAQDALVVRRLRRAGAIPVGKTAMNPLGWSADSEPKGLPHCANPRFPRLATGGSSSGSAAAVAARLVPFALGTDVAGSVRIPAAFCGVVGFKPRLGGIPMAGVVPITPSFDLTGIIAGSAGDVLRVLAAMSRSRRYAADDVPAALRVGMLSDLMSDADGSVREVCEDAVNKIRTVLPVQEDHIGWTPTGFGRLLAIELAKSWGSRIRSHPDRFTPEIVASCTFGERQGEERRAELLRAFVHDRRMVARRLAKFDVLIAPTLKQSVPAVTDPVPVDLVTSYTRIFNVLGWPAFVLPCGVDSSGVPVSLQIVSRPSRIAHLFTAVSLIENALLD